MGLIDTRSVLCPPGRRNQQGGLLASWVEPLFLSSIVLGADPRTAGPEPLLAALRRAVPDRAAQARVDLGQAGVTYPAPSELNVLVAERVVFDKCKSQVSCRSFFSPPRFRVGGLQLASDYTVPVPWMYQTPPQLQYNLSECIQLNV